MKEFFEQRKLDGIIKIKLSETFTWVADKSVVCSDIIGIVNNFRRLGYTLTLRQLYYQLVAADKIPNHLKVYKKIGKVLDDLRYSGKVDWNAIEDRGRGVRLPYWCLDVPDAIRDIISSYRLDRQEGQKYHIEIWTEKDAVSSILYKISSKYHIRLVVNKGYSSSTAMYRAYKRFVWSINEGTPVRILYMGDHDPSGLDMVRDIEDRIVQFLIKGDMMDEDKVQKWWEKDGCLTWFDVADFDDKYDRMRYMSRESEDFYDLFQQGRNEMYIDEKELFSVMHVGLTTDQIKRFNPPPNPAKITDSRADGYIRNHGRESWELDAISPPDMEQIIEDAVLSILDEDKFSDMVKKEKKDKLDLQKLSDHYQKQNGDEEE